MPIQEIILTVVAIVAVTLFFTMKSRKVKKSSWEGELIKKKDSYDDESGQAYYKLIFRTDAGKKVKLDVHEQIYREANVGDRYKKVSGSYMPEKVQKEE